MATPTTTKAEAEKLLVAEILTHLGHLLIAKSPIKSAAQKAADEYRGKLLSLLDTDQRKPFLESREIVVELAKLLATCQDRAMLGRTLAYLKSLSQGEVMIVADDTADEAMRERLSLFLVACFGLATTTEDLNDIINIVRNLNPQDHDAEQGY